MLLLTNDTQFAERLTNPDFKVPKTYQLKAASLLSEEQIDRLRRGIELSDGLTLPAQAKRLRDSGRYTFLELTLTEGRNRQVLKLVRTAIGPIRIGELKIGSYRHLTPEELRNLHAPPVAAPRPTSSRR